MKHGFTLVELIVVITILSILGTIGFVSLTNYTLNARDSARISQLATVQKSLDVYRGSRGGLPLPDQSTQMTYSGTQILQQGVFGTQSVQATKYSAIPLDPISNTPLYYAVTPEQTQYQLLGFLEGTSTAYIQNVYAVGRGNKIFKGAPIGIFLDAQDNLPAPGILEILQYTGSTLTAHLSKSRTITGTGGAFSGLLTQKSCQRSIDTGTITKDGEYSLLLDGVPTKTYCTLQFPASNFYNTILDGDFESLSGSYWTPQVVSTGAAKNGSYGLIATGSTFLFSKNYSYINPSKKYILKGSFRSAGTTPSKLYFGVKEFDENFTFIDPKYVNAVVGTDTIITHDTLPTESVITLLNTSGSICSNISPGMNTRLAFYTDPTGEYSDLPNKNISASPIISKAGTGSACTLTFNAAHGMQISSGTSVRVHLDGSSYNYSVASDVPTPFSWTDFSGEISGHTKYGYQSGKFRRGTKFVQIMALLNFSQTGSAVTHGDDIILEEVK